MFRRNNRIWLKYLVCKSSSVASNQVIQQTSWHSKRILRKGYLVPRDFSWIENYKLKQFWSYQVCNFYQNITNIKTCRSNGFLFFTRRFCGLKGLRSFAHLSALKRAIGIGGAICPGLEKPNFGANFELPIFFSVSFTSTSS